MSNWSYQNIVWTQEVKRAQWENSWQKFICKKIDTDVLIGNKGDLCCPKGKIELSGGTPSNFSGDILIVNWYTLGISVPFLPKLLSYWDYCFYFVGPRGKQGSLCEPLEIFHLSSSDYWLAYTFDIYADSFLTDQVVVIIWNHILQGFLKYSFYEHQTPLRTGHTGSFIEFLLSYFDNKSHLKSSSHGPFLACLICAW